MASLSHKMNAQIACFVPKDRESDKIRLILSLFCPCILLGHEFLVTLHPNFEREKWLLSVRSLYAYSLHR